jgi:3-oxoacyl-[acyl-carrier protein] reductase
MDLGLAGRVAAVTGSSQGIGRATALLSGSEGARGRRDLPPQARWALAVVDEIENGGGEAVATELDLAPLAAPR